MAGSSNLIWAAHESESEGPEVADEFINRKNSVDEFEQEEEVPDEMAELTNTDFGDVTIKIPHGNETRSVRTASQDRLA